MSDSKVNFDNVPRKLAWEAVRRVRLIPALRDIRYSLDNMQYILNRAGESLERIPRNFDQLRYNVDQLLAVSECDDPRELLKPKKVEDELGEFLREVSFSCERRFQLKGKTMQVCLGELAANTSVLLDIKQMREVFDNLIANALEHGGSDVLISARALPDDAATLQLIVSDNGNEVDDDFIRAVLAPETDSIQFVCTASSRRGQGLSFARQLVEAHGGMLQFEKGTKLKGANFVVTLPDTI